MTTLVGRIRVVGGAGQTQQAVADDPFVGASPVVKKILRVIGRIAAADETVLITGESGTGKEMIARMIWAQSKRRGGDFVVINCAAIPEGLLESELFGHQKGAFTGAYRHSAGRLERAEGGVVLLDEIGEIPLPLQVKLLRFIEHRAIERVGDTRPRRVDVRILAATNRDLKKAVAQGLFREDLYYRLNVLHVALPPLRERGKDIVLLAEHTLRLYLKEISKKLAGFDAQAERAMLSHSWPGNVRELINRVKRAAVLADGPWISVEDLELQCAFQVREGSGLRKARQNLEADYLKQALIASGGKASEAAHLLKISRSPTLPPDEEARAVQKARLKDRQMLRASCAPGPSSMCGICHRLVPGATQRRGQRNRQFRPLDQWHSSCSRYLQATSTGHVPQLHRPTSSSLSRIIRVVVPDPLRRPGERAGFRGARRPYVQAPG